MREHAWPLVPWHSPNFVHTQGWQLWCQVHKQRRRQALDCKIIDNIHINRGLDRRPVLWDIPWLGLCQQNCWHLHAGVHQEENTRVWTSCPKLEAKMPLLPLTQIFLFRRKSPLSPNDMPKLDANGIKHIQQSVGSILYYARAVDITVLMALSTIAVEQTKATEKTMGRCI